MSVLQSMSDAGLAAWKWLEPWFEWESIKAFANSAFTTSLVGALAGAFAGARAAQLIAERGKLRDETSKQIRDVNAAMVLSFTIVNDVLALKKQHVREMSSTYNSEVERYKEYKAKRLTGQIQGNVPYELKLDLRTFPTGISPIAVLQEIVFSKTGATGRPLSLASSLSSSLANLNVAIARRNELIEDFKRDRLPQGANIVSMYLGLPYEGGHVNQEYGDIVSGIASYTDDAIFFSHLLCQDLRAHGLKVVETHKKLFKDAPLRVNEIDFRKAEEGGLLPAKDDYNTWFEAFVERKHPTQRWWQSAA